MTTTIHCPCGAVTIELSGEPAACFYCHCNDCQAVHGAAYVPAAMYWAYQTRVVTGELGTWKLKTTRRATCGQCGTRVFAEPSDLSVRTIMGSLLPEGIFRPTFHIQCQHAWLPVRDDLPHFKGFPAILGGSDELVGW